MANDDGADSSSRSQRSSDTPTFWHWLRDTARLWGFLGFILVVLIVFRAVIQPFVLAVLVSYVLAPLLGALTAVRFGKRHMPRVVGLILLYLALFGLGGLFFTSFVPRVSQDLKRVVGEAPALWKRAQQHWVPAVASWLHKNFAKGEPRDEEAASPDLPHSAQSPSTIALRRLSDGSYEFDSRHVRLEVVKHSGNRWLVGAARANTAPSGPGIATQVDNYVADLVRSSERGLNDVLHYGQKAVLGLISAITTLILVFMISAFLLVDTERILAMMRRLVDARFHDDFDNVVGLIDKGLSGAIRGQLLICLVNGVLTWIGLKLFSVKYGMLLAVLAGVMSLIPIFGSILSSIPIVLVAITSGSAGLDIFRGVLMLLWIIGIHLLEANLLNPKIIGTAARIHPVIVIFAVVAGERTYGPIGALLGVPLVSAIQAVFLYVMGRVRGRASQPT